jgi:hypothetical protein
LQIRDFFKTIYEFTFNEDGYYLFKLAMDWHWVRTFINNLWLDVINTILLMKNQRLKRLNNILWFTQMVKLGFELRLACCKGCGPFMRPFTKGCKIHKRF